MWKHGVNNNAGMHRALNDLQVSGNGGVAGQRLWRQFVFAVGAVQEGLAALSMTRQVGVWNQTRT